MPLIAELPAPADPPVAETAPIGYRQHQAAKQ